MKKSDQASTAVAGSLVASFAGQGALALSGPLTARLLGVTGRGELAIVLLFVGIAALLGGLGVPTAIAFFLARYEATTNGTLWPYRNCWLLLCAMASAACALGIVAYSEFIRRLPDLPIIAPVASVAVGLFMTQQLTIGCFQGERRYSALSILRVLPALLTALAVATAYVTIRPHSVVVSLMLTFGAYLLSTSASLLVLLRPGTHFPRHTLRPFRGRDLTSYGIRALLGASSPLDALSLDQAFVGLMLSPRLLGFYVVATAFANLTTLVLQSVGLIMLPKIAAITDVGQRRREVGQTIALSLVAGVAVCIAVELVLPSVLAFAFGRAFLPSLPSARVLVAGGLFLGMRRLLTYLLQALDQPGSASFGEGLGIVVLLVVLGPAILLLHEIGAALAISLSALMTTLYMALALNRDRLSEPSSDLRRNSHAST